ncbi:hypothetical protein ACIOJD_11965 [Streptomyces sp. NPDC088116]|uniref:hypothetical protein n=1 Tax=Streptomyces sp. NPDC088116 TaxID=3365825 RepID=UPI0037F9DB06
MYASIRTAVRIADRQRFRPNAVTTSPAGRTARARASRTVEGPWPRREGDRLTLGDIEAGAVIFRRGEQPSEIRPGHDGSALLRERPRFDTTAA